MARKYHCEITIVDELNQVQDRKYFALTAASDCETPEEKWENLTDRLDTDLWPLLEQGRPIGPGECFAITRMTDRHGNSFCFDLMGEPVDQ